MKPKPTKRKLGDWITTYLELTNDTEPPLSYHTWVALSSIAAALERKCWLNRGYMKIYPNMYIVLVGPSGKCRKGTAMGIGREIVAKTGVRITAETMTRESLIRTMADAQTHYNDPTTRSLVIHTSMYTVSEELSVFLGQSEIRFLSDLTDWYDSRDEWKYETKGSGKDHLENICFNLLGATAPDWLSSILPPEAIGGGFTSRIIFVVEDNKRNIVADPKWTQSHELLQRNLIHDLEVIHQLKGAFTLDDEAHKAYMDWYVTEEKKIKQGYMPIQDPRFGGYCDRRATHLYKISMAVCASRTNSKIISLKDFERAQSLLFSIEPKMPKVFSGLGDARYGKITQEILDYIMMKRKTTREEVMQIYYRDLDMYTLGIVEEVLKVMGAVKVTMNPMSNVVTYEAIQNFTPTNKLQ